MIHISFRDKEEYIELQSKNMKNKSCTHKCQRPLILINGKI